MNAATLVQARAAVAAVPPVIGLRGVGRTFHDPQRRRRVRVLRGVNLDVHAGEIICVVGPSGCGKSTLLNGIGGFRPFTEGDARIDGRPIHGPGKDRGVVFQDYPVPEFLSALDNVALGLNLDRLPLWQNLLPAAWTRRRREHLAEAAEYLAQVGLTEHAHKFPHEMSGGQRQRVAIAQALAMRPRVLLMDEPFSGLDPRSRENLQLTVLRIHEQLHNTIFFVTHDLEEAVFIGNRIIVLSQHAGAEADTTREGATIVHERDLAAYKDPEVKRTPEFAALLRELRATFGDARFAQPISALAPSTVLVKSK